MSTILEAPTVLLHGMPFLDDAFAGRRLLAAVAAARHVQGGWLGLADGLADGELEAWLAPARAFVLRQDSPPMPAAPLTTARRSSIAAALAGLTAGIPPWELLLRLPVRFALLQPANGAISASSRAWPQHVLLSAEAFATSRELSEQLVHELCHQWLYLIEEVWPLEAPGAAPATLPSGTTDRSPAEILGAAHVAAALIRMYGCAVPEPPGRIQHLRDYGTGCLQLLDTRTDDLTEAGRAIAGRLKEAM